MPRSDHSRPLLVAAACLSGGFAVALGVWLSARDAGPRAIGPLAPDLQAPSRSSERVAAGNADAGEPGPDVLASLESADRARARKAGFLPPPPDTLAALQGRVVDGKTHEPLPGLALTFLSRRPKTVSVVTDAEGHFQTGVELATGIVAVMHVPDPTNPVYAARWTIEPNEFLLPRQDEGGVPRAVTLNADSPQRVLEIDVKMPDGAPASGASVTLTSGKKDNAGELMADARTYEVADSRGRARFALFGPDLYEKSYRLEAEHKGTLASDVLEIDPPIGTRPRDLELFAGGVVRVHATSDEGKPLAGVSLWISTNEGGRWTSGKNGDTDARGETVFAGLRAACWTVSAVHPLTGQSIQREIDLPRGGKADIEVRLTIAGLRLGVSGTVLDELGFPLAGIGMRVQSAGEEAVDLETRDGGLFEFWGRPSGGILISTGGGFLDDRYEPALISVPFGTTNVQVRRLQRLETVTQALVVVDAHSGKPCPRATIVLYHAQTVANGLAQGAQKWAADSGVAQVTYKLRDDTAYVVDAPGYQRAQGKLADLIESAGAGLPLRVELEHGFERRVEVRDRITKRLLSGARFVDGNGELGVSDSSGAVLLKAEEWPAMLRIECTGYEPLVWDPAQAAFPGTLVHLEPLRAK